MDSTDQRDGSLGIFSTKKITRQMKRQEERKKEGKKKFNIVVGGLLVGTSLISALVAPVGQAKAMESPLPVPNDPDQPTVMKSIDSSYQDESGYLATIDALAEVLDLSVDNQNVQASTYQSLLKSINALETHLMVSNNVDYTSVEKELTDLTESFSKDFKLHDSKTNEARTEAVNALNKLKERLGMDITATKDVKVVKVAVTKRTYYTLKIGTKKVTTSKQAFKQGSKYYVGADNLKQIGGVVSYSPSTKKFTVKYNSKTLVVKVNDSYAYVNGKKIKMGAKSQAIGGKLFLTSDVYKHLTGKSSKVTSSNKTIVINYTKKSTSSGGTITVGGIKTLYGHTYGVKSQKEYDYVMAQAKKYLAKNNPKSHKLDYDTYNPELRDVFTKDFLYYVSNYKELDKTTSSNEVFWDYEAKAGYQFSKEIIVSLRKDNPDLSVKQTSDIFFIVDYVSRFERSFKAEDVQDYKNNPRSAYDVMVHKRADCDSIAHVQQLMLDLMGYKKSKVTGSGDHAALNVYMNNGWRGLGQGNTFVLGSLRY